MSQLESMNLDKVVKDYLDEQKRKEIEKIKYVYKECDNLVSKILDFVKDNKKVLSEEILYFPEKYPFSLYDFDCLFDLIADYLDDEKSHFIDDDNPFQNRHYYFSYENNLYDFFIIWGQGVSFSILLVEENDIKPKYIGDYNEFKKYLKQKHKELKDK